MFLVLQNQQAKPLKGKIFPKICMPDSILFVYINHLLAVIQFIALCCLNDKFNLILYTDKLMYFGL